MLVVLVTEHGQVGFDDMQQLGDHGAHPAKMAWAMFAFERVGQRDLLDPAGRIAVVHLLVGRRKYHVDFFPLADAAIRFEVTRIAVEVLVRPELGRVDEDAHHHRGALVARRAHQRHVTVMQGSHGRDQGNAAIRTFGGADHGLHLGCLMNHFHNCSLPVLPASGHAESTGNGGGR